MCVFVFCKVSDILDNVSSHKQQLRYYCRRRDGLTSYRDRQNKCMLMLFINKCMCAFIRASERRKMCFL